MKSRHRQASKVMYVRLRSLDDLARYVCNYDYTSSALLSAKHGKEYRIMAIGEKIGSIRLAYYVSSVKPETVISYTYPSSAYQKENSHFMEGSLQEQSSYMRIIRASSLSLRSSGRVKVSSTVMLSSASDLVTAVLLNGAGSDSIPYLYSFDYKGSKVLCAFDIIDGLSDDSSILYCAVAAKGQSGNFARYKYSENKIDFTDHMGEHSYMYAKIIHLAEPFPFFKMPD